MYENLERASDLAKCEKESEMSEDFCQNDEKAIGCQYCVLVFFEACLTSAQTAARSSIRYSAEQQFVDIVSALGENIFDEEVEIGSIASMPDGWKPTQLKPEYPKSKFSEYIKFEPCLFTTEGKDSADRFYIGCENCGLRGPERELSAQAIDSWNRVMNPMLADRERRAK